MAPALPSLSLTPKRILSPAPFNSPIMLPGPEPLVPYCPGQAFCICMKIRQVRARPLAPPGLSLLLSQIPALSCALPCPPSGPPKPPSPHQHVSICFPPRIDPRSFLPTCPLFCLLAPRPPQPYTAPIHILSEPNRIGHLIQNYSTFLQSCGMGRAVSPTGESSVVC